MSSIHLSDDGLLAFVEGTVSTQDRLRWLLHVDECRSCHDLLAAAAPAVGSSPNDDPAPAPVEPAASGAVVRGTRIGRFTILERIGIGATAEVHAAYDPQLDRRVALKLLRTRTPAGDLRLLREAQALARLSHPNVVSVFDAGDHGDRSFVAMEFVVGDTLRSWLADRTRAWPEVVRMFVAAGGGLAAAHAVGIVHRDFKPDNVLVGSDGRPRVADFGLARTHAVPIDDGGSDGGDDDAPATSELAALTRRGATVGTPVYMAPEQLRGQPATPASDQFAFCVAVWEGLYGTRPFVTRGSRRAAIERGALGEPPPRTRVPSAIHRALVRGLSARAAERWPSLDQLLDALERMLPHRRRRRAILGGAAAGLAAGASLLVALGRLYPPHDRIEPCSGGRGELAATWNAGKQAAVIGRLRALGDATAAGPERIALGAFGAAEAQRVAAELDAYGGRWLAAHHGACLASRRGELTAQLYERDLTCLEQARAALGAIADVLGRVPANRVPEALVAARSLPDPALCPTRALASSVAPPPAAEAQRAAALARELAQIRIRALAADPEAPAAAAGVVARAEQLGYRPLVANARLVEGQAWSALHELARAAAPLERAATDALAVGDDVGFVEAYARYVYAIGRIGSEPFRERTGRAVASLPVVEQLAARLGDSGAAVRSLLFQSMGASRLAAGDRPGARTWFVRALAEPGVERNVELITAHSGLAIATSSQDERDRQLQQEYDSLAALVGRQHLLALDNRHRVALLIAEPVAAARELAAVCGELARLYPQAAIDQLDQCWIELGWLAAERGDAGATRDAMVRVTNREPMRVQVARAYLGWSAGRLAEAVERGRAVAAAPHDPWWELVDAASVLVAAAEAHRALGQRDLAVARLEEARSLLERDTPWRATPYHQRRAARTHALLAQLEATRAPARARAYAGAALAWYRSTGGYAAQIAELEPIANAASGPR